MAQMRSNPMEKPTAGTVLLAGRDLTSLKEKELAAFRRDNLGFVFQDFNLLDTLTGLENIALALTISGTDPRSVEKRAREAAALGARLESVSADSVAEPYPVERELSRWEQVNMDTGGVALGVLGLAVVALGVWGLVRIKK